MIALDINGLRAYRFISAHAAGLQKPVLTHCARPGPPEDARRMVDRQPERPGSPLKMHPEYFFSQQLEDASRVHLLAECCGAVIPSLCSDRGSLVGLDPLRPGFEAEILGCNLLP